MAANSQCLKVVGERAHSDTGMFRFTSRLSLYGDVMNEVNFFGPCLKLN